MFTSYFIGVFLQLSPFAFLCLAPFKNKFAVSDRKMYILTTLVLILLSALFAFSAEYFYGSVAVTHGLLMAINLTDIAFIVMVILCFVWYFAMTRVEILKKLFVFVFSGTVAFFVESFSEIIHYNFILDPLSQSDEHYMPESLPILAIITFISVILLWILLKKYYLPISEKLKAKETLLSVVIAVALLLMLIVVAFFANSIVQRKNTLFFTLYMVIFALVVVVYFAFYQTYCMAVRSREAKEKLLSARHYIEITQIQYDNLTNDLNRARKNRHDLRTHLIAMQGFLQLKDYSSLDEYLSDYLDSSPELITQTFCKHDVINAIVGHYSLMAKRNDIAFYVKINMPESLYISPADMAVVLGNLLQNAISAATYAHESAFIKLNILGKSGFVSITMDNTFDGNVKKESGTYISTKKNHRAIGISSIANIAERLGGSARFDHKDGVFLSSVVLGNEESNSQLFLK